MIKRFSNFCLVTHNGMLLVQNTLRPIHWELYQGAGTYSEVCAENVFLVSNGTRIRKKKMKYPLS